jgi:hypothetical protein
MIVCAAVGVIEVAATTLVAVTRIDRSASCASCLGSFVCRFVDVLVLIAARTLDGAATSTAAAQAGRVAGRVDRITGRTAATSCKSQKTTAGE